MINKIEAYSLTLLIEHTRIILANAEDINQAASEVTALPLQLVAAICEKNNQHLHKFIELTPEQYQENSSFIAGLLTPKESMIKDVANGAAYGFNPLGKFIRDAISEFNDSPEFHRLVQVALLGFGMDIVLAIWEELLNRGVSKALLLGQLIEYQTETLDNPHFDILVFENIDAGIVSGAYYDKIAKRGELAGNMAGVLAGAKAGAAIGCIVPGPGNLIGAAVGAGLGGIFGKDLGNKMAQKFGKKE